MTNGQANLNIWLNGFLDQEHFTNIYQVYSPTQTCDLNLSKVPQNNRLAIGHSLVNSHGEFTINNSAIDCLVTCDCLEKLKMEQFYMLFSEARRVIREGGIWIVSNSFEKYYENFSLEKLVHKINKQLFWKDKNIRSLDLKNFISPEDWVVLEEKQFNHSIPSKQVLVLRRENRPL